MFCSLNQIRFRSCEKNDNTRRYLLNHVGMAKFLNISEVTYSSSTRGKKAYFFHKPPHWSGKKCNLTKHDYAKSGKHSVISHTNTKQLQPSDPLMTPSDHGIADCGAYDAMCSRDGQFQEGSSELPNCRSCNRQKETYDKYVTTTC